MSDAKIVRGFMAFVVILAIATIYGVFAGFQTQAEDTVAHLVEKFEMTIEVNKET